MSRLFIGYDPAEADAYAVCRRSFRRHHPDWQIARLDLTLLRCAGLFDRPYQAEGAGFRDLVEHRPFSTLFAFSRFLVPWLCGFQGVAMFCDADFLWRRPLDRCELRGAAVAVVKHDHRPGPGTKMRGQVQFDYARKNWSSLVIWDCGHPANRVLTPELVGTAPGLWLHAFSWLDDDDILGLPETHNWLEGYSATPDPLAVHFTRGVPPRLTAGDPAAQVPFADEWLAYA